MRELQVCRAERESCKVTAESVCREMTDKRAELDAAIEAYEHKRTELAARDAATHDRLLRVHRDRSAAESALEAIRDRVENELKARRTASTVRAYRLDMRCRQLHDRYRGFVMDVLRPSGDGTTKSVNKQQQQRFPEPSPERNGRPRQPARRRFFAVADKLSADYRRESLRTSRSLHVLMTGYLRETAPPPPPGRKSPPASCRRRSLVALHAAEPATVLGRLRVMQEQCARIAERVRRRSCGTAEDGTRPAHDGGGGGGKRLRQAEALCEARRRLAAVVEYADGVRRLTDVAISEIRRERRELRVLLCKACATCAGSRVQSDRSYTAVEIAGKLEWACFALFARLDRTGALQWDRPDTAARDVMTSCLRAVQEQRVKAVRRARDEAYRVDDFRKAVGRLLLATTTPKTVRKSDDEAAGNHDGRRSSGGNRKQSGAVVVSQRVTRRKGGTTSTTATRTRRTRGNALRTTRSKVRGRTSVAPNTSTAETYATAVADVVTVTALCPPSVGAIEYE